MELDERQARVLEMLAGLSEAEVLRLLNERQADQARTARTVPEGCCLFRVLDSGLAGVELTTPTGHRAQVDRDGTLLVPSNSGLELVAGFELLEGTPTTPTADGALEAEKPSGELCWYHCLDSALWGQLVTGPGPYNVRMTIGRDGRGIAPTDAGFDAVATFARGEVLRPEEASALQAAMAAGRLVQQQGEEASQRPAFIPPAEALPTFTMTTPAPELEQVLQLGGDPAASGETTLSPVTGAEELSKLKRSALFALAKERGLPTSPKQTNEELRELLSLSAGVEAQADPQNVSETGAEATPHKAAVEAALKAAFEAEGE